MQDDIAQFVACRQQAKAAGVMRANSALQLCMHSAATLLGSLAPSSHYFVIKVRAKRGNDVKYATSLVYVGMDTRKRFNTHVLWQRYFVGAN